jgi:RNA polymerase sigma factor (sigma-70 family)
MAPAQEPLQERFHRDLRPGLIAFFARRVGSVSEAEDLAQEVYLRLARSPETGLRDGSAYVFQIAANLLRDRARRLAVRGRHARAAAEDPSLATDPLDPHRVAAGREALAALVRALDDLPERTRTIFLLYRYEQMGRQAIADSFGISVSAVEKHVYRAMALLSARLGEMR